MVTREQSERSEEAMRMVFQNQFRVLTRQVLENLYESSKIREKWATKLLLILGAILLVISLLMRVEYPFRVASLSDIEFTALIFAASGLMFTGALFSLLHTWSWRSIIRAQQVVGMEILNKQSDVDKELLTGKNRHQAGGELILLPTKIRKRRRC